ncbi:sensor histidine kinase [Bombiscardovia coagulans]|uniref:histidine kinase n=1 Tax=Bombiscardovia coagulans TaxID=686666 RepID=A0A261ETH1_9BIFI|nr:HAMP domain-containing sensor histidine kinase [Bombiscardovia coagulans]OZG50150.1 two-component system sensor histidine kinase [Bombiscardovia coagulans]
MILAVLLIAVLLVTLVVLSVFLALTVSDMARMSKDLEYIHQHDTKAMVTVNSGLPLTRRCVTAINENLLRNRRVREQEFSRELRIRQMLTNVTHDIKTPLTVARGYVQLLDKQVDSDIRQYCQKAASSLDSVDYYLQYLMDFNLLHEKTESLTLSQVNLSLLVQEDLFTAFDQLQSKVLKVDPNIEMNISILSDETLLHRIMQNLVGNWLKYAVRTAQVHLYQKDDGFVELVFSNETDQPYVQARQLGQRFQNTRNGQVVKDSSGLGLHIVQGLVDALGGQLCLRTKPGFFEVIVRLSNLLHHTS